MRSVVTILGRRRSFGALSPQFVDLPYPRGTMKLTLPIRALAALCTLAAVPIGHAADTAFAWPHGAKAAVSLAYDDAIDSQLDNAIPALDRAGLKGSFYIKLASPSLARRMPEWRAAAAHGHELGNHTLFHQCSAALPDRKWVAPEDDIDTTTAARLVEQIRLGNTMLHAIDGKDERTFTVPCGDVMAAGEPYVKLIHGDFVAIKSGFGGVVADMDKLDPYNVAVNAPDGATGEQLIVLVKQAAQTGTMINFTFHGVGGDYIVTSNKAHEELLAYLAAHRDTYWTDTFLNIMKYVKAQQATRGHVATK
jgi:peptidoglycan/xylan/chitin deacetylase (PgdA/CDA1 family)